MQGWRAAAEACPAIALALALGCGADPQEDSHHAAHASGAAAEREAVGALPPPGSYTLPPLGLAADGRVLTRANEPTRLYDVFGDRVVLLSFVYTRCPDAEACPLATGTFRRIAQQLRQEDDLAGHLRLVSLSFDPEFDTPEVMSRYARTVGAADLDWSFLTTTGQADLAPILEAYGQHLVRERDASGFELGTFSHVLRVFLVDRQRRIRQVYSSSFLRPEALLNDVKTLLLEEAGAGPLARGTAGQRADARPGVHGPGDDRRGYERTDYQSRSTSLGARRGRAADLLARLRRPPLGLPAVPIPPDSPASAEKVALGRRLFFDRRLSHNDTISCGMCHIPEQGFASNETATSVGIEGRTVRRNAPTIYNTAYLTRLFHDARETRLEHQIWGPLLAANEMGNPSVGVVVEKIRRTDDYAERFEEAFPGRGLALETIGMALASYERTLVSGDSPFDRWRYGGDEGALDGSAQRGFRLFTGEAACASCHLVGPEHALFTDGALHNTGVGFLASMGAGAATDAAPRRVQVAPGVTLDVDPQLIAQVAEPVPNDLGRYEITLDPRDRWKYRTPSLRNVALTPPYMHDGSLATLEDVVRFYAEGGIPNDGLDPRIRPLDLDADEQRDLVAFLRSLTGSDVPVLVADAFAAPVGDVGSGADAD